MGIATTWTLSCYLVNLYLTMGSGTRNTWLLPEKTANCGKRILGFSHGKDRTTDLT